jgi:PKD-like domain
VVGTTCASSPYSFNVNCSCANLASVTITGPSSVCSGGNTISLTSIISNANNGTWSVLSGAGSVSPTICSASGCTTTFTSTTAGTTVVRFISDDADGVGPCQPDTATKSITVYQTPSITGVSTNGTATCGGSTGSFTITGVTPNSGSYTVNYTKNGVPQSVTASATAGSIVISGLTAGSYTNISISINGCNSNTLAGPFTISDPNPPTGVVSGPSVACEGVLTSAFSVSSLTNCSSCSYSWSSSDGTATTPTGTTTTFTFTGTGTQTAQVIITSGTTNCSSTISKNVTVSGVPVVTGISQGTCVGFAAPITVNATVNPIATLEYALDGGTYQSSNAFSSVANGNHSVTARVVGTACASSSFTFNINCTCASPASVSISGNGVICSNQTTTLTATIANASTATWSVVSGGGSLSSSSCSGTGCTTIYTPASSGSKVIRAITNDPDGSGPCDADTAIFSITVNPTPTVTGTSQSNPTTCLGSDGSITLTGVSPTGTYTVNYTFNSIPQSTTITSVGSNLTINGLTAGVYANIIITQSLCGSAAIAGPFTLVDPTPPSGIVSGPTPVCNGTTTTAYSISSLTNCNSCTYLWSSTGGTAVNATGSTTAFNINATGTQTVQVIITNGVTNCSSTLTKTVVVNGIPVVNGVTQGSCIGSSADATINASVNPNAALEYSLDGITYQSSSTFASLANGNYTAYARVIGTTCASNPFAFTISCICVNPPSATISGNSTTCSNSTVVLSANFTNANTGTWSIASGTGSLSTTSCSATGCVTIYTPPTNLTTATNMTIGFLTDDPDGVGPCNPAYTTFIITVNPQPVISSVTKFDPTTCGGCDGSFTINGLQASKGYTVSYQGPGGAASAFLTSNINGQITVSSLCTGTYSNIVVTLNGCPSAIAGPVTLNNPTAPVFTDVTPSNTTTCGGSEGSVTLSGIVPNSGAYTVTYTFNGLPQTYVGVAVGGSLTISNLSAGSYGNFVISRNGCLSNVLVGPYVIGEPTPPSGTVTGPTSACLGVPSSNFGITGETNCSACIYAWSSTGGTANSPSSASTTFTFSATGTQTVQLQITSGTTLCSSTISKTTNVSGIPVITGIVQGTCVGFSSSVTVNASVIPATTLQYSLDGGTYQTSNIFASVANGSHTVTAKVLGTICTSASYNFTLNCACANPASASISGTNTICNNSSTTLTATIFNASSGTWSIVSGGGNLSTTACSGTGCSTVYTAITSGTKTIRFISNDEDGVGPCEPDTANYTITVYPVPTLANDTLSNPTTCGGSDGTITFRSVSPDGTYSLSYLKNGVTNVNTTVTVVGGTFVITGLTIGSYTNFVIEANGCSSATFSGPIILSNPLSPSATITNPAAAICHNTLTGLFSLSSVTNCSACSYSWTSTAGTATSPTGAATSFTFTALGNQTVNVTLTNSALCSSTFSSNVFVNGIPSIASVSQATCIGFARDITVNASVSPSATLEYSIDGGTYQSSNIFTAVANGNHSVTARVVGTTCTSAANVFNVNCACATPASANITGTSTICSNSTSTLTGTIANASTGTWQIVSGGGSLSSSSCSGSGCNTIYTPASSGTKVIRLITNDPDLGGPCEPDTAIFTINVNPTPTVTAAFGVNPTTCGGSDGILILTGVTPTNSTFLVNYTKNGSGVSTTLTASNDTIIISGLSAGSYTSYIVTKDNCPSNTLGTIVTLVDPAKPAGSIAGPNNACNGIVTTSLYSVSGLTNCSGCTYNWTSAGGTATTNAASTTTFNFNTSGTQTVQVVITNSALCSTTLNKSVNVDGIPLVQVLLLEHV